MRLLRIKRSKSADMRGMLSEFSGKCAKSCAFAAIYLRILSKNPFCVTINMKNSNFDILSQITILRKRRYET